MSIETLKEQEYQSRFDWKLWRQILSYAQPFKKELILLGFVMVAVAAIDAAFPYLTKVAIDEFVVPGTTDGLGPFIAVYTGLIVLQGFNVWSLITLAGKVEMGLTYRIRRAGFRRLQELSLDYYDTTAVGWLLTRMTSDTMRLGEIISWGLVDIVWGFTMMTAIMVVMFSLNWQLALITFSVLPILFVASMYFQAKILRAFRHVRRINSRITGAFNEGINGAKTTKLLNREEKNLEEFSDLTESMRHHSVRAAVFSSLYLPVALTLGTGGTALAVWFGGTGVIAGTISYGVLVAFVAYTIQFFEPIRELARIFAELQSAHAAAERMMSMIETEPTVQDRKDVTAVYGDSFHPKKENWPAIAGRITFDRVWFSYNPEEPVLEDFNLEVDAGETIALVGETGSGKSTIINLACRFYEPTQGRILVDGVDYRERSQAWLHSNLGYVLQSPHLFSGTIRDNIRYGQLDASDEDIERAAKLVNAHEFITRMPKGYGAPVGESGNLLSTGQKQLISFARAVLADPRIFVLDEATSSIDTETEQLIQNAIQNVLEGRTSFIVAHRLSTIRRADRILVIRDGRLQEEGNHEQLMEEQGYYYRLYTNQFLEDEASRQVSSM